MTAAQTQKSEVVTSVGNGKSRGTKIALIALAVFFLIVLSEVAYLLFSKNEIPFLNTKKESQVEEEADRTITNFPFITTTPSPQEQQQSEDININYEAVQALVDNLKYLEEYNKVEQSDSAGIYFEIEGTVIVFGTDSRVVDDIMFSNYLSIEKPNGSILTIRLTEEEVSSMRVVLYSLPDSRDISMSEIRQGDTIIVKQSINILDATQPPSILLEIRRKQR